MPVALCYGQYLVQQGRFWHFIMLLLQKPQISTPHKCVYLEDRQISLSYFFARDISEEELNLLLENGWRKFGLYFFRPACQDCRQCIPIRIPVDKLKPQKSRKRLIKKNEDIEVRFSPLTYSDEIYEIYKLHSLERFNKKTSVREFTESFYTPSCNSLQSEYFLNGELIAVGFLDRSVVALNSVYFIYKPEYVKRGLGIYSIITEAQHAAKLNLKYYYMGYYIEGNPRMSYKNSICCNEKYDWETKKWE